MLYGLTGQNPSTFNDGAADGTVIVDALWRNVLNGIVAECASSGLEMVAATTPADAFIPPQIIDYSCWPLFEILIPVK